MNFPDGYATLASAADQYLDNCNGELDALAARADSLKRRDFLDLGESDPGPTITSGDVRMVLLAMQTLQGRTG